MMEINVNKRVKMGTLCAGDTLVADNGNVYMIVDGGDYIEEDDTFTVIVVNLETGVLDRYKGDAKATVIHLVAEEK